MVVVNSCMLPQVHFP